MVSRRTFELDDEVPLPSRRGQLQNICFFCLHQDVGFFLSNCRFVRHGTGPINDILSIAIRTASWLVTFFDACRSHIFLAQQFAKKVESATERGVFCALQSLIDLDESRQLYLHQPSCGKTRQLEPNITALYQYKQSMFSFGNNGQKRLSLTARGPVWSCPGLPDIICVCYSHRDRPSRT